jgi:ribosomal protein S19
MCEKTIKVLEGRSMNQHLATVYHTQLKIRTKIIGESLQEFTTTIEQLAHHTYHAYPRSRFTGKQTRHLSTG